MKLGLYAVCAAILISAGLVAPALALQVPREATPAPQVRLPETTWHLVEAALADSTSQVPDDPSGYTIQFLTDGRMLLRADCNEGAGVHRDRDDGITLTDIETMDEGCPAGSFGGEYVFWLSQVIGFELMAEHLVLLLEDGGRLRFVPTLGNVLWEWQRLEESNGRTLVPADPADYTLRFHADGNLDVRADCNTGGGRFQIDGPTMEIEAPTMTRMACDEGSLADEFVRNLEEVTSFTLFRGDLALILPMDAGVLLFTARADPGLMATPASD